MTKFETVTLIILKAIARAVIPIEQIPYLKHKLNEVGESL